MSSSSLVIFFFPTHLLKICSKDATRHFGWTFCAKILPFWVSHQNRRLCFLNALMGCPGKILWCGISALEPKDLGIWRVYAVCVLWFVSQQTVQFFERAFPFFCVSLGEKARLCWVSPFSPSFDAWCVLFCAGVKCAD